MPKKEFLPLSYYREYPVGEISYYREYPVGEMKNPL